MKRQNNIWYIKIEGEWIPLVNFPSQSLTACIISTILYRGATIVH